MEILDDAAKKQDT